MSDEKTSDDEKKEPEETSASAGESEGEPSDALAKLDAMKKRDEQSELDEDQKKKIDGELTAPSSPYPRPEKPVTRKKPEATIWQRATYRWTAITAVMATLLVLYTQHPYYQNGQFTPWRSIYPPAFVIWLALGLFYCKATLEKFQGQRYMMRDGGLHLVMLGKILFAGPFRTGRVWLVVPAILLGLLGMKEPPKIIVAPVVAALKPALGTYSGLIAFLHLPAFILVGIALSGTVKALFSKELWRRIKNPRVRTTLLAIIVKGFFTPLMIGFFSGHTNNIVDAWMRHKHAAPFKFVPAPHAATWTQVADWWAYVKLRLPEMLPSGSDVSGLFSPGSWNRDDISWGLQLMYDFVFFVDCGWALFGYSSESRWLGNKTRSVEPTFFGWAVALACYPPFNNVLGTYLPLETGPQHIQSPDWHLVFKAVTVFLFCIYSSATVAFGFKFSNLTNRGIVSRGPYAYVRHPAYLTKCTAWWLEHIPTMTITKAFFLSLLCCVYALRAWTEERHLSMDPEYREYKKKVPWVIFPGFY